MSKSESLPVNWNDSTVGDILKIRNGFAFKSSDYLSGAGTPLIRQSELVEGKIDSSEAKRVATKFLDELPNFVINKGDLLIGMSGSLGKISSYADESPALQNQRTGLLVIEPCISRSFASFVLQYVEPQIVASGKGIAVQNVSSQQIESCKFPLPPLNEQVRIVEKVEELLSDLNAGVAELKAAQRKLVQYRQSLLKAAVEGALTADWRRARAQTGEPQESGADLLQRILTERRTRWETKQLAKFAEQGKTPPKDWKSKYPEPVAPDNLDLPTLPESWVWTSVEQLGEVQLGRQRSPEKMKGLSPVQYIRAANITEQGIDFNDVLKMDFSETEIATFRLNAGDVLLTEASGSPQHVGRPVVWPKVDGVYCFQNTVIRFVPRGIESNYAFCIFQAWQKLGIFQKLSGGVGINHLSAGKFLTVAVPLPSKAEQNAIVDSIAAAVVLVDQQDLAIEHSLKQSAAQRKNILKAAFAGQLVPQDPSDEPASVLLDRIRAERATGGTMAKRRGTNTQPRKVTKERR